MMGTKERCFVVNDNLGNTANDGCNNNCYKPVRFIILSLFAF
jgi:hypothetical protein